MKIYYTLKELVIATLAEWHVRGCAGFPACPGCRFTASSPIVVAHVGALAGLQRAGGGVVSALSFAKASNVIRRMHDEGYSDDVFGSMLDATVTIPSDQFHQFDVWNRGPAHAVTADSMRPKLSQTLRRIIARLPERGIRPNVAIQVVDASVVITGYRLS